MESQSPGATWGWACGLDPTRAVGERKESDKVRTERVRDTQGSACAKWLGVKQQNQHQDSDLPDVNVYGFPP